MTTTEDELRQARLAKLELLKEKGIDPYPADSHATHTVKEVIESFENLESSKTQVTL